MIEPGWTRQALRKYILLEIPPLLIFLALLWLLLEFTALPFWLLGLLLLGWLIKDVLLFFYTWPAYDANSGDRYSMRNQKGTTLGELAPQGYIRVRGERWRARAVPGVERIETGRKVRVVEVQGLTLLVEPEAE